MYKTQLISLEDTQLEIEFQNKNGDKKGDILRLFIDV